MFRYLVLLLLFAACGSSDTTSCPAKTCSDYKTQVEAQAAYDASKTCLKKLDDDSAGVACEMLATPGTGGSTGSPTTAACGCSNKTKDQMDRWIRLWVQMTKLFRNH